MKIQFNFIVSVVISLLLMTAAYTQNSDNSNDEKNDMDKLEKATFGSGCFWCSEAIFERVDGVVSVTSGYAGGAVEYTTYEQVCTGTTGHAEVIQISYDPEIINFKDLLYVFWRTHDPTTLLNPFRVSWSRAKL